MTIHTNSLNNLLTPAERAERQGLHEAKLLRFLRDETYSSTRILGQLLGVKTKSGVLRILRQMEKKQCIKSYKLVWLDNQALILWGITPHGIVLSYSLDEDYVVVPHFEPYKINLGGLQHVFDIQVMRIKAEASGWTNWVKGDVVFCEKGEKIPDAMAADPVGFKSVIEVERHAKTKKRYAEIAGYYLAQMNENQFHRVDYICPTQALADRLGRLITLLNQVSFQGKWFDVEPAHFQRFHFWTYKNWPANFIEKKTGVESGSRI